MVSRKENKMPPRPASFFLLFLRALRVKQLARYRGAKQVRSDAPRRQCAQQRQFFNFTPTPKWRIWIKELGKKAQAIMASKTSRAEDAAPIIDLAEMGARVAARKAALGLTDLPRNNGKRRTESKKALLKAIEDAGGKW